MGWSFASMKWDRWLRFREAVAVGANSRRGGRPGIIARQRFNCWRLSLLIPGHAVGRTNPTKTAEDILMFLEMTGRPEFREAGKIYVVWDNFSCHKKAVRLWTSKPAGIEFIWTPTTASWLNLIEPWFLVLQRTALYNTNLKTTDAIAQHLEDGINYLNEHPRPYRWSKTI